MQMLKNKQKTNTKVMLNKEYVPGVYDQVNNTIPSGTSENCAILYTILVDILSCAFSTLSQSAFSYPMVTDFIWT